MAGGYEPFPIYDFRSGLHLDREPWLLPSNAFSEAYNVYCSNGRIYKRKGFTRFATGNGGTGVVTLVSPPVMGIYEYYTSAGTSSLLALDTDYLYKYNSTNDNWDGVAGYTASPKAPDFTGDSADFFWAETWQDIIFFTNNKDAIKYWNGTTLATLSGTNVPSTCKLLLAHKNRLIALNTYESSTRHPQRYRCSNVGSYSTWDDDIYADADTVGWIIGASFVRGELMVFFERSVWWLRYTADPDVPFSWEKIADTEGVYATYSVVDFENESIGLGPTSWISCDGLQVTSIDEKIPDLVVDMNPESIDLSYGFIADELRQYMCSFTSSAASYPDRVLCYNYVDDTFSIFIMQAYCFGYWSANDPPVIDSYAGTIDSYYDQKIDEKTLRAGYPINLMGDRYGHINQLFDGTTDLALASDTTESIWARFKTKMLVPYPDEISKLGYVDIIGDANPDTSLVINFYKDYSSSPYKTSNVSFESSTGGTKVRVRVRVMENAIEGHSIAVSDVGRGAPFVIDAIIPYFRRAGIKR